MRCVSFAPFIRGAAMPKANQLKQGSVVEIKDEPYIVKTIDVRNPSSRGASTLYKIRFAHMKTQQKLDETFKGDDILKEADCQKVLTQFSYREGDDFVFMNLEDYDEMPDTLINPVYKDQKMGYAISAKLGRLSKKGDWLVGYYYVRKEEYSVVSYYTEDDWIRLGNINRNRNTNYQGHEIRFAYAFDSRFNVVARAYFVKGLVTHDVAKESGNRFRLDFNMKFNKPIQ